MNSEQVLTQQAKFKDLIGDLSASLKNQNSVILISGGIDSMTLLNLLCDYRQKEFFNLTGLHFNFKLRGTESDRDEFFVRDVFREKGIPLVVVPAPLSKGPGIQLRARDIRYSKLQELSQVYGWTRAFLGHQADDQLETLMMRMMRGAGARGLSGIPRVSHREGGLQLIRPLLSVGRNQIESYAERHLIRHVEDSSNKETFYLRNQIRKNIIPSLRHSQDDVSLLKSASQLSAYNNTIHQRVVVLLDQYKTWIPQDVYRKLNSDERYLFLEKSLKANGYNNEMGASLFHELDSQLQNRISYLKDIGPALLEVHRGRFRVIPVPKPFHGMISPIGPGIWLFGGKYRMELSISKEIGSVTSQERSIHYPLYPELFFSANGDDCDFELSNWKLGERFYPYKRGHRVKIADFLGNLKIPRSTRRQIPVLRDAQGEILCIPGIEISDFQKITDKTKRIWKLKVEENQ